MTTRNAPPWAAPFWAVTGALLGFGTAGILTIGLPMLAAGLILLAIGLSKESLRNRSALGMIAGLVLVAICVAIASFHATPPSGSGSSDWL